MANNILLPTQAGQRKILNQAFPETAINNAAYHLFDAPIIAAPNLGLGSFQEATFPGYPAGGIIVGPPNQTVLESGVEVLEWPSKIFTTAGGQSQVIAFFVQGACSRAGNFIITVSSANIAGSPVTLTFAVSLGTTAAAFCAGIATAMNSKAAITAYGRASAVPPAGFAPPKGTSAVYFTVTTPAANDASLSISQVLNGTTEIGIYSNPSNTVIPGRALFGISYLIDGVYVTDSLNTILIGFSVFATPVVLTAPGQNIPVQCGLAWGA